MYYVYVLQSKKDLGLYIGYTKEINKRLKAHASGKVKSTKNRRPLVPVYYEGYLGKKDATARERHLKTHQQRNFLKEQIKNSLMAT
ncbi:GIY-YIG nuclease family protein [Patescibacteria group bacterium]|nr:GIY-YIG nuclease family protein [Patescibacteria group bacterium]MBU1951868.1 GIY-YIG nuclease family protein [Patescibacteria group bacterium]